jgi:selenoprotein W-related protein
MSRAGIQIEYCTSCNYLPRALWIAAELLPDLQYEIGAFTFLPGTKGLFEVKLGDALVFSKAATGRFPDPDELKQAIFEQLEAQR